MISKESLPRQVQKTIDAVLYTEHVPFHKIASMLKALGFIWKAGAHQNWRHPDGYRVTFPHNADREVWGYLLKDVRDVLQDMGYGSEEDNNVALKGEKLKEKPGYEDTKDYYDTVTIAERSFKDMTKLNLTQPKPEPSTSGHKTTASEIMEALKKLGSMVQSAQEFLLDISLELKELKTESRKGFADASNSLKKVHNAILEIPAAGEAEPAKKKMPPDELRALRLANLRNSTDKIRETKKEKSIAAIKEAVQKFPDFKDSDRKIAALAGVSHMTVRKYREQGLI